jgi:hypothetical protein
VVLELVVKEEPLLEVVAEAEVQADLKEIMVEVLPTLVMPVVVEELEEPDQDLLMELVVMDHL